MQKESLKFVIVGHVDHGKSTLIGRLFYDTNSLPAEKLEEVKRISEELGREVEFAFVMDHLQEERDQGITIDTAQAFFHTDKRDYVIIDAPGHKEFIKNMVTGASQAEAALLIVDAEEGVREQTRRHAYLLSMLGLKQVAVIINKMDRVEYAKDRFDEVAADTVKFLDTIGIAPMHVVPISAKEGDNVAKRSTHMDWYDGVTTLESLDDFAIPPKPADKPMRLPIQDVYKVGDKRMLLGRVESGTIHKEQSVVFLPSGTESKLKSIEKFMESPLQSASAGESIGLTLEDSLFVERGQVACLGDSRPQVTDKFKANLFWMNRQPMSVDEPLTIRCATQEISIKHCEIRRRIDSSSLEVIGENATELKNNEIGELTIETKSPIVLERFYDVPELGRFVVARGHDIVAGGIITH
ncbi:MAG: sulfate adenylyltransferase subunit 1 [Planctomycetota bacterium]|jgi:sulfate adenylyltransferase large subunit